MLHIRIAQPADIDVLARMCVQLWPHVAFADECAAIAPTLAGSFPGTLPLVFLICEFTPDDFTAGAAVDPKAIGFAEVSLRSYADGCDPRSPVGYLEGWFVEEEYRGQGVGRALLDAAELWARRHGCTEFASDTSIGNTGSQAAHEALGFELVDRCVHYRKRL